MCALLRFVAQHTMCYEHNKEKIETKKKLLRTQQADTARNYKVHGFLFALFLFFNLVDFYLNVIRREIF